MKSLSSNRSKPTEAAAPRRAERAGSASSLLDCTGLSRQKVQITTRHKVIKHGDVLDVYVYESPIRTGVDTSKHWKVRKKGERSARAKEHRKRNMHKTREKLRRLINSNFEAKDSIFLTLTFADTDDFDIGDIEQCNKHKAHFFKKLREHYPDLKYLGGVEFQKRGAVHYHVVLGAPYIPHHLLEEVWGKGFVSINDIGSSDNVGAYIVKYFSKNAHDIRLKNHRAVFYSKGLDHPRTIYGREAEAIIARATETQSPVYESSYESKFNGKVTYREFNPSRKGKLK